MFPFLNIFGFNVPMYGFLIALGIAVCAVFAVSDCKRRKLLSEDLTVIVAMALLLGFIGAKLAYIFITYSFDELSLLIKDGKLSELLGNGGFVFYGGLIFGVAGAFLGARLAKVRLSGFESLIVKYIPLAHAFGRMGCLCAGCCYGRPTSSHFSVIYTAPLSDAPTNIPLVPIQGYEAAANLLLFILLFVIDKKRPGTKYLLPVYLFFYAIIRYITEIFRYDAVRGSVGIFSTSQFISIFLFFAAIVLFAARFLKSRRSLR